MTTKPKPKQRKAKEPKARKWNLYNIAGKPTAINGPKIGIHEMVMVVEVVRKPKARIKAK